MSKLDKINNYHIINNFPAGDSIFKKALSQIAFSILITKLTMRRNYLTNVDYQNASEIIKPGDVILVGGFRSISGIFMGKLFTHSLIYTGNQECVHADADGVDTVSLVELFDQYDTFTILRPKIFSSSSEIIKQVISFARGQIGKPYDFYFEHRYDSFFCTQLIHTSFHQAGFDTGLRPKHKNRLSFFWIFYRLRKVLRADDFLKGNFKIVFVSESLKEKNQEIEKLRNIYQ